MDRGTVVISRAGHDKQERNGCCLMLNEREVLVMMKTRTIKHFKKKNVKHLQKTNQSIGYQ